MLKDRSDAIALLKQLGAPGRLVYHAQLVSQAAELILVELQANGVECDVLTVELGAILHDTGKIQHPQELSEPGSSHEAAGEALLLSHGVQPLIARCCASHGAWNQPRVTLEERVVALADKLWKGKRDAALELSVIDEIAARLGVQRWDIFERRDTVFEEIADGGSERVEGTALRSILP
jgi:hypothetical protein